MFDYLCDLFVCFDLCLFCFVVLLFAVVVLIYLLVLVNSRCFL